MDTQPAILNFFQAEFSREQDSDFAVLKRIPSTSALMFLDYFSILTKPDQAALTETFAYRALFYFFPAATLSDGYLRNPAYQRYRDRMLAMGGDWKYHGTRSLKSQLADTKLNLLYPLPYEVAQKAQAIKPVKAPEIRRVVKAIFSQAFSATATNNGGGNCFI